MSDGNEENAAAWRAFDVAAAATASTAAASGSGGGGGSGSAEITMTVGDVVALGCGSNPFGDGVERSVWDMVVRGREEARRRDERAERHE